MSQTNLAPKGAVIFCRVIDNFGDAGVTWRLAKRLRDLAFPVTLVIDDFKTLGARGHDLDTTKTCCDVRGIRVVDWDTFENEVSAGNLNTIGSTWPNLVLETFGCRLPDAVEKGLCDGLERLYMNLDYLSAEDWVEGSHKIWGLHPSLPIKKLWYFPGFTDKTGGVLIEDALDEARQQFDRVAWLTHYGAKLDRKSLFFFAYPVNAIDQLAAGLRAIDEPINLLLAPGAAGDLLTQVLDGTEHIHLVHLPFVPQESFDDILRAADAVIIRGEDSFVRAQLAGTPLLWAIYPTEDKAHEIKLDAWLARFETAYDATQHVQRDAFDVAARHWVTGHLTPDDFKAWWAALPVQREAASRWRDSLLTRGDLARHIVDEIPAR